MTTVSEIKEARLAAGAAYAAAAQAYLDAYVELHAHDKVLNGRHGGVPGFPELQPPTPHAEFLKSSLHGACSDRVATRVAQINKSMEV